jgi:hypothetical protein
MGQGFLGWSKIARERPYYRRKGTTEKERGIGCLRNELLI